MECIIDSDDTLLEDDEIDALEDGFMRGADDASQYEEDESEEEDE